MTVTLITASPDDWSMWRSVRLAALAEAPEAFGSRLEDWSDADEDRWRERLSIPGAIDLVAVDPGTGVPIGMVTGTPAAGHDEDARLISMWVDPTARGRGVATSLIGAVVDWTAASGARRLTLSVRVENHSARRTYEQNGFDLVAAEARGDKLDMTRTL